MSISDWIIAKLFNYILHATCASLCWEWCALQIYVCYNNLTRLSLSVALISVALIHMNKCGSHKAWLSLAFSPANQLYNCTCTYNCTVLYICTVLFSIVSYPLYYDMGGVHLILFSCRLTLQRMAQIGRNRLKWWIRKGSIRLAQLTRFPGKPFLLVFFSSISSTGSFTLCRRLWVATNEWNIIWIVLLQFYCILPSDSSTVFFYRVLLYRDLLFISWMKICHGGNLSWRKSFMEEISHRKLRL